MDEKKKTQKFWEKITLMFFSFSLFILKWTFIILLVLWLGDYIIGDNLTKCEVTIN